jgi:hypothetical protein
MGKELEMIDFMGDLRGITMKFTKEEEARMNRCDQMFKELEEGTKLWDFWMSEEESDIYDKWIKQKKLKEI